MKIAITGGIGSGKSHVCKLLKGHDIDVYDCDSAAKRLMNGDASIRNALTELIGSNAYAGDKLNKAAVAQFLLQSEENKLAINEIVHPAVADDFYGSGKDWLESAILFESGFDKRIQFDCIICVAAPLGVRIDRVCRRDGISREQAMQWISGQMPQEEIMRMSSHVIHNDGQSDLELQINNILNELKK